MSNEKVTTPPYLSVRKIAELVDIVSSRNFSEGITTDSFKSRNFGSADAALAVNTLKFLNLITEEGVPTEAMQKMRIKGDDRKPEFAKIFRQAYKGLYDVVDDPLSLTSDKLTSEFIAIYKLSDRIAKSVVPAFNKFAVYSGLREEKAVLKRSNPVAGAPKVKPAKTFAPVAKKAPAGNNNGETIVRSGFSALPISGGKIELHLPEQWKNRLLDDESIEEKWRTARAALKDLADALDEKTEEPTETETTNQDGE